MAKYIDLTNQTFERLTVIKRVENNKNGDAQWLCRCNCDGKLLVVLGRSLRRGLTKSCGCFKKEKALESKNKKYNTYDLTGECGIGYATNTNEEFYFDLEEYNKIKDYCWSKNNNGYIVTNYNNSSKPIHQIIMNYPDDMEVDHKDRNKLNNRKENFRIATHSQNSMNKDLQSNNTSGIIGVSWYSNRNRWSSEIMLNKKKIHLGYFINKEDAIKARLEAEVKYFKEFAPQQHLYEKYNIKVVI